MICYHCGYKWEYKGSHPFYATCPKCMKKINLAKVNRIHGDLVEGLSPELQEVLRTKTKEEQR